MPLIEDHEEACPTIPEAQLQFVLNLDDTYKSYTRFIAALLIPRPSYAAFFRDLRSFRSQPVIISLLSSCDSTKPDTTKEEIKQRYREITTLFLQSRWSHPWCRKAAANQNVTVGSTGWWGAEWTSTGRRMGKKEKEAEDRLHQLLLPIWIIMRGRMFPGEETVTEWWRQKQDRDETQHQQRELGLEQGVMVWLGKLDVNAAVQEICPDESAHSNGSDNMEENLSPTSSNPFRKGGEHTLRPVQTTPNLRQDFWDSAEAEELDRDLKRQEQQSAQVATSAFRLVATSMLLSTVPKWKLKRLLKTKS